MHIKYATRALMTAALLVSAAALISCSSGAGTKTTGGPAGAATKAAASGGKAQTVAVTLKDNVFEPKEITVEKGAVTFEVKNAGAALHNMHIVSTPTEGKDFSSKVTIEGGASDKFTATFTKTGAVKFQCDLHMPDMVGTITVK